LDQATFARTVMFRLTNARALAKAMKPSSARSFHSPFAVLGSASPSSTPKHSTVYEKATDASAEELAQPTVGPRTHVVSPNPTSQFYQVPTGAYPVRVFSIQISAAAVTDSFIVYDRSLSLMQRVHPQIKIQATDFPSLYS
jgi:hypothetical protein